MIAFAGQEKRSLGSLAAIRAVEGGWQHDQIVRANRKAAEQAHPRPETQAWVNGKHKSVFASVRICAAEWKSSLIRNDTDSGTLEKCCSNGHGNSYEQQAALTDF
jgi:hypothetical protein